MASETEISNSALRKIGADTITSLEQGNKNANVMNDLYETKRDDLLRGHQWNFATKRVKLAQGAATPVSEFDHEYPLPADFMRVVEAHDNDAGISQIIYKLETDTNGNKALLTSSDDVYLTYIFKVTDPNVMTPDFREALAYALAEDAAIPIANSNTLRDAMEKKAKAALRKARSTDSIEDQAEEFPVSSWIADRTRADWGFGN